METRISKSLTRLITLLVAVALLYAGCSPAATAVQQEAAGEPAAEAQPGPVDEPVDVTNVEPVAEAEAPSPSEKATLRLMIADSEAKTSQQLVEGFMAEHPDIQVELEVVPYQDFEAKLRTSLAAGDPPDVASLGYNLLNELTIEGYLLPIEEFGQVDQQDYVGDSLSSGVIQGTLVGLPHRRFACLPSYQYLALFKPAAEHGEAAFRLIEYFTGTKQQAEAYHSGGWSPVRLSVIEELGLDCPTVEAIRLEAVPLLNILSVARERTPDLEGLTGQSLNPKEANAVVEDEKVLAIGIPPLFDLPGVVDKGQEVVMGALIIEAAPDFPPGDYALLCAPENDPPCKLVGREKEEIPVYPEIFERTISPVEKPQVTVEPGSFLKCFYLDSLKVCIRIG